MNDQGSDRDGWPRRINVLVLALAIVLVCVTTLVYDDGPWKVIGVALLAAVALRFLFLNAWR